MGKQQYEEDDVFLSHMDRCNGIYKSIKDKDHEILGIMFSSSESKLARSNISQPALVALEWSLARTIQDHGVFPTIVLGHSVGEITAACVAGDMSIVT